MNLALIHRSIAVCTLLLLIAGCAGTSTSQPAKDVPVQAPGHVPPVAKRVEHITEVHGLTLVDSYFWLRDRANPETIAYLEAENAYAATAMATTEELQNTLYEEMIARIEETDLSVPVRHGDYVYYSRTEQGKNYPILCRKPHDLEGDEQVLLDQNAMAEGHDFFSLNGYALSDDHRILAYLIDTVGNERATLRFKDLTTGEHWGERIANVGAVAWASDAKSVFYTTLDETNRPDKLLRHTLGTPSSEDVLVYHEADEGFYAGISKTRSGKFLILTLGSIAQSEVRYLAADQPDAAFALIAERQPGVEYYVEHQGDHFLIMTNEDAQNFRLMRAATANPARATWEELIAHRPEVMLAGVSALKDWLIIHERERGLAQLRVRHLASGEEHHIKMPESVYALWAGENLVFDASSFRIGYSSLVTPESVFDYDLAAQKLELKKEQVVKQYDRTLYETKRVFATAADGTQIPISIVHKKGIALDSNNPVLLVGYGSYGYPYDPYFSSSRVSLLERNVIYALAHIRGGGELGRPWYEAGKLMNKRNTFTDFIASAEHLIAQGYTRPERLAIQGGSAGGLLMGAVINLRPELFGAVIADVPFVDVINTMLDPSIPLTVIEYKEWGNPNERDYFDYMRSYAPYENVVAQDYPAMLITAGLNDSRVAYWEPAKWAAKLRAKKTDDNLLLLKTNMGAGHGGASGRYNAYREIALSQAFILNRLEVPTFGVVAE
ncbi:MAG: S9 family peptidase [Bradymonadaceae bacterium]|nr:S9 family peptidase [Lujinxingiaceae bacterium]